MKPRYETVRAWAWAPKGKLSGWATPGIEPGGEDIRCIIIRERDWRKLMATMREYEAIIRDHEPEWKP
jgi:hypothetical protein